MNEKTLAAISLDNRDFPSLRAKLEEAARWIELAAAQGAELAVLPEMLNAYRGDGPDNPHRMTPAEIALDDWQAACSPLLDAARRAATAVTVPLIIRRGNCLHNSFFLASKTGELLGEYHKAFLTDQELSNGIQPGRSRLIEWEGLKVGGAICFDTNFPHVFARQADADLFLIPSLWPGGAQLNHYALEHAAPIVLAYPAWSRIIDIDGRELASGGYRNETLRFGYGSAVVLSTINFDRVQLHADYNQEKMLAVQQHYGPRVRIRFDQPNCLFILESRSSDLTVREVMQRFDLISRRQYLARCKQNQPKSSADTESQL
jgi:predicted amidohydrolase